MAHLDTILVITEKISGQLFDSKKRCKELQNRSGKRDVFIEPKTQMLKNNSLPGVARAKSASQRD